jgi:ubiquinone/menaquinone biosynthesis C-methylase UbiE
MNFDSKAEDWDKDPEKIERAGAFAAEILKSAGNLHAERALEFGSGTGLVSFSLRSHFDSIILADSSAGMTGVLREKIRREGITNMIPYLVEDSNPLVKLSGFDVVYTLMVIHHVKDIDGIFRDFHKVMNPGGMLFIGDLETEDGSFHRNDPEFDGHMGFDTGILRKKLLDSGFETATEKIFYVIEREHNSHKKQYPLFFLAAKRT